MRSGIRYVTVTCLRCGLRQQGSLRELGTRRGLRCVDCGGPTEVDAAQAATLAVAAARKNERRTTRQDERVLPDPDIPPESQDGQ